MEREATQGEGLTAGGIPNRDRREPPYDDGDGDDSEQHCEPQREHPPIAPLPLQALYPIKRFITNKSLYKYRISLKNLKNEVLKIYTIEFEQFYQPRRTQISYPAFEELVWDLFTYVEMQMCEAYAADKTFEISFDLVKDHETTSATSENLTRDWELISCD
ncbi:hypothetical protein PVNG_06617, partial [Plasmodium vivax North Korean]